MRKWAFAVIALAGVAGGAGVILSGIAAHGGNAMLQTAANFLLFHASAAIAAAAVSALEPQRGVWYLGGATFFLIGSALFCSDLALLALAGRKLFPFAAPAGATFFVLGWSWIAAAAFVAVAVKQK